MPKQIKPVPAEHQPAQSDWPLIRKFRYVQRLENQEIDALVQLHQQTKTIPKRKVILNQGDANKQCLIITDGWAYRFSKLRNGNRQVINYYVPGDIISPFALFMPKANYSVASITDLQVAVFKPDHLIQLFATHPRLGLLYGWMLGRNDALVAEQVIRIGRRSAYKRTAHLLLELYYRLKIVGLYNDTSFSTPLTQDLLADTLGLSIVHMNRTLRKLQADGMISGRLNEITLLDIDELMRITESQPRYLEQTQQISPVVSQQK